jgi:hypothetical protein
VFRLEIILFQVNRIAGFAGLNLFFLVILSELLIQCLISI